MATIREALLEANFHGHTFIKREHWPKGKAFEIGEARLWYVLEGEIVSTRLLIDDVKANDWMSVKEVT